MVKLDQKDKKILYQLEKNCRQPITTLAKNVGLSREVVNYRIKQLEKYKVIQYYVTSIDYTKLGLVFCRTFYRYNNVSPEIEKQMIEYARNNPFLAWIANGEGDMNLALVYITDNLNMLQGHYYEFLYRFGSYFKQNNVSIAFQIYAFNQSYLHGVMDREPIITGFNKSIVKIDDLDYQILLSLMKDPKITLLDMSKSLKSSVKTLNNRIKNLTELQIIRGFRIKINHKSLDLEHHKVFLFLEKFTREKLSMLISYLSQQKETIFITVPLGNAHLEFEVVVERSTKLFEFMRRLSINFPDIIKDYESSLIYDEPFTNYIPKVKLKD